MYSKPCVIISLLLILITSTSLSAFAKDQKSLEERKIEMLLEIIEKSGATFIRNGESHPAVKAKSHLEFKYNKARNMFWFFGPKSKISALEFIEKIASKSSTTGEIYKIKPKDATEAVPTEQWMKERLKEIEEKLKIQNPESTSKKSAHSD
jgi:hypothetical protein